MVRRAIILILLAAATVYAVDKPYYQFPDAIRLRDSARILVYDNLSGSRNITGAKLRSELGADTSSKLDVTRFANYSSKGRFSEGRFTNFSSNWGKADANKLDVPRFTSYSANHPPQTAATVAYNSSTVAAALDQLLYVPISITSYTMNGSGSNVSQEVGTSYTVNTLAWTTNKASPTLQQINGVDRTSPYSPGTVLSPSTPTTYTYTLHVHDGADQSNASSSRSVAFYWSRYWTATATPRASITSANVNAMSSELSTSHSKTVTYDCTGGKYPTFAYPVSFGTLTAVTVGGLSFSDFTCSTLTHTNSSGGSPGSNGYYVCQFNNIQTGSSITVVWD
jgi:hypothetical protein